MTILLILVFSGLLHFGFSDDFDDYTDCKTPDCGERAPLSFGFIVLLFNSRDPNITCLGAIIAHWWVLDNCEDFPGYAYEQFRVGWATPKKSPLDYNIHEKIQHPHYQRVDLKSDKFDASSLFAAKNALFLRRSNKRIVMVPEIIIPIKINRKPAIPRKGVVVYIHNGTIFKKLLRFFKIDQCNKHFESYFDSGHQMCLESNNICVNPENKISPEHCCHSQAFLVADSILMGIMAWSTQCDKEFLMDPWVFSHIGMYTQWIFNATGAKDDMDHLDVAIRRRK